MQEQIIELSQGAGGMQQLYGVGEDEGDDNDGILNLGGGGISQMFNI